MLFTQTVGWAFDFAPIAHGLQEVARGGGFASPQIAIEADKKRLGFLGSGGIKRQDRVGEQSHRLCSGPLIFTMNSMVFCQTYLDLVRSNPFRDRF